VLSLVHNKFGFASTCQVIGWEDHLQNDL